MKKIFIFSLIGIFGLIFTACPDNSSYDYSKRITFINNSNKEVAILLADGRGGGTIYPDTMLPIRNSTSIVVRNFRWELTKIHKYPQDSIYLFVLDPDTIAKYPWAKIREDYNIIKRYDLSWKKLAEDNDIIYP